MKNILVLFFLSISLCTNAQPQAINYQGVARNASGQPLINQNISLQLSILDGTSSGTAVYTETQNTTTNSIGLFNISIGSGTIVSGLFANILWGQDDKWLKVEMDTTAGSNFQFIGTSQFLSVPYALHSGNSDNGLPSGNNNGDMLYWNGTSWITLAMGGYGQSLFSCNGVLSWGGCTPQLFTTPIYELAHRSAVSGGFSINDGGAEITARGVCWNTSANPTILNNLTNDGTGSQDYASDITGLNPSTTYHIRSYATNSIGTSYGNELVFTTLGLSLPSLTTASVNLIFNTTAISGGNVTDDGGSSISAKGVCWNTSTNPTLLNGFTNNGSGIGNYISNMAGLVPNTTYYVRAYATNSIGTSYGNELSFTTTNFISLPYVSICSQVWSSQNLNVTTYRNGDPIPQVTDSIQWLNLTSGAWCWYNNDSATYAFTYGKLYNWYAVNDPRGLAPAGWNIPTDAEWSTLETCLGGSSVAGGKMKTTGTSHWIGGFPSTNSSGFSGLPGGGRASYSTFEYIRFVGSWWSSSQDNTSTAWSRFLFFNDGSVGRYSGDKTAGFSVRCISD